MVMLGDGLRLTMMMVVVELVSATSSHGCALNSYSNCVGSDYQDDWKMVNELKGKEPTPILSESHEALQRGEFGDSPFGSFGRKFTNNGFSTRNSGGSGLDSSSGSIDPNQGSNTRSNSQVGDQFGSQVGNQFGSSSGLDENRQGGRGSFTRFINEASTQSRSSPSPSNNFNSPHSNSFDRGDTTFREFGSRPGSYKPWNPNSVTNPTPNTRSNSDFLTQSPYNLSETQHHSNQARGSYDRSLTPDQSAQSPHTSTSSQSNDGINNIKNRQSEPQSQSRTVSRNKYNSMRDRYFFVDSKSPNTARNSYYGSTESRLGGNDSHQSHTGMNRNRDESRLSYQSTQNHNNNFNVNFDSSNRESNENFHSNTRQSNDNSLSSTRQSNGNPRSNNRQRDNENSRYETRQPNEKPSDDENRHPKPVITVERISGPPKETNVKPSDSQNQHPKPIITVERISESPTQNHDDSRMSNTQSQEQKNRQSMSWNSKPRDTNGNKPDTKPTDTQQYNQFSQRSTSNRNTSQDRQQSNVGSDARTPKVEETTASKRPEERTAASNPHQTETGDQNQGVNSHQEDARRQTQQIKPHQTESRDQTRERNPHQTESRDRTREKKPRQADTRVQIQERVLPTRENSVQLKNKIDIPKVDSEKDQAKKYPYRGNRDQNQVYNSHQKDTKDKNDVANNKLKTPNNQTEREKTPNQKNQTQRSNPNERDQTKKSNPNERDQTKEPDHNGRNQDSRQECPSNKSSPRPVVKNLSSPGLSTSTSLQQLYNEVNRIRQDNCLPPLSVSSQLQQTAEMKCQDMEEYFHNKRVPGIHDWGGTSYACRFTNLDCMEEKPRQLTGYPRKAHEISAWYSGTMNVEYAINGWIHSSGHFDVLSEQGNYKDIGYLEMGACISAHNSNIWFGKPDQQPFSFSHR